MTHSEWATGGDPWYADMIDTALREADSTSPPDPRVCSTSAAPPVASCECSRRGARRRSGSAATSTPTPSPGLARRCPDHLPRPAAAAAARARRRLAGRGVRDLDLVALRCRARRALARRAPPRHPAGGLALITTHGAGAIAYRAGSEHHGEAAQRPVVTDLYRRGFSFVDAFGAAGDWGVVDREWGVSFIDPEWMLRAITPQWSVALYRPAAIGRHQDLWVLCRQ